MKYTGRSCFDLIILCKGLEFLKMSYMVIYTIIVLLAMSLDQNTTFLEASFVIDHLYKDLESPKMSNMVIYTIIVLLTIESRSKLIFLLIHSLFYRNTNPKKYLNKYFYFIAILIHVSVVYKQNQMCWKLSAADSSGSSRL